MTCSLTNSPPAAVSELRGVLWLWQACGPCAQADKCSSPNCRSGAERTAPLPCCSDRAERTAPLWWTNSSHIAEGWDGPSQCSWSSVIGTATSPPRGAERVQKDIASQGEWVTGAVILILTCCLSLSADYSSDDSLHHTRRHGTPPRHLDRAAAL